MSPASAVARPPLWWLTAASFLVAAYAVVLVVLVALHAGGNWIGGPASITVPAAGFELVRGKGHRTGGTFVVEALDPSGTAILSARVAPFAADQYPRVDWKLAPPGPTRPTLALLWRTRERPDRTFVKPLQWQETRVAPLELAESDGWSGTVIGVALAVRGELAQPLVLEAVVIPEISAASAAAEVGRQWTARHPFKLTSITFPFDDERYEDLSLLTATALAVGLGLAGYVMLARRRRWPLDARVLWAVFLGGWLVLDARWQINLWRQHRETAQQFAGKTTEEKHLAAVDHEMFTLMREVRDALPPAPVRILFLSDSLPLRERAAFFLYPHNVNAFYLSQFRRTLDLDPDHLHAGDHVLLFLFSGTTYDRSAKMLVWPDGRRRAVDEVLWKADGVALLRVT